MRAIAALLLALAPSACGGRLAERTPARETPPSADRAGWRALFNGRDLDGWTTWLGTPHPTVRDLPVSADATGRYLAPIGRDRDPTGVFQVVQLADGPAIRISGEIWGALISKEAFADYHLRLQFRWGERQWPPREHQPRDSGLLYHSVGAPGASGPNGGWMQSLEFQIQEGDTGDLWLVAGTRAEVPARLPPAGERALRFDGDAAPLSLPVTFFEPRVRRSPHRERAASAWNQLDLLVRGNDAVHVVNGEVVLWLANAHKTESGRTEPLVRGRLQLQSEGAEIYFRHIELRPLRAAPDVLAPWPQASFNRPSGARSAKSGASASSLSAAP